MSLFTSSPPMGGGGEALKKQRQHKKIYLRKYSWETPNAFFAKRASLSIRY